MLIIIAMFNISKFDQSIHEVQPNKRYPLSKIERSNGKKSTPIFFSIKISLQNIVLDL